MFDVVAAIDDAYEKETNEFARRYIGASGIGGKCDADLAWSLRGFPNTAPEPQLKRIFYAGHRIEDWVVRDMKKAGIDVLENDPMTGKQWEYKRWGGHVSGHADGIVIIDEEPFLLEIKSMNLAKFTEYEKKTVQYSHSHYYAQVQFMMGMSGLKRCLFIAYCKNNSKYHTNWIEFDEFYYLSLEHRSEQILNGHAVRCSTDAVDWRCKGCFKRGVCWEGIKPEAACVFCTHAYPSEDGKWNCNKAPFGEVCGDYEQYNAGYKT
tara:strand:+ start:120 stop:911 length:792 start_codon:yes stop_codon:yes gene_type:complete